MILYLYIVIKFFSFFLLFSSSVYCYQLDPFDVRNSPIEEFIQWVSDQSGENIILGSDVDGLISVHVNNIDSDDVISLFIQVMDANGYDTQLNKDGFYLVTVDKEKNYELPQIFTKVYKLNNLRNTKAIDVFNSLLIASSNNNKNNDKKINPTPNFSSPYYSVNILPASNSLLISGTFNQINTIDRFISEVDTDSRQVMIEAVILETDLSNSESIGINLSTALSTNGFTSSSNMTDLITSISQLSEGAQIVFSKGGDIRSFIKTIARDSNIKILSTPNILVMDRETGRISVGQNVPFLSSQEITDNGNTVQKINRQDVGVTLNVTPHILSSGDVVLNIVQESSSVTESTQASDIITNKRLISTVAKVDDGQTIILGGLVSDEERFFTVGVPLLKNIPWLGRLFRAERSETTQRELTVMIKTAIVF